MISFSFLYGIRPRTASGILRHVFLSAAARLRRAGSKDMRQHRMHIARAEKMFSDYIYIAQDFILIRWNFFVLLSAAAVEPRSVQMVREERDCKSNNATDEFSEC